MKPVVRVLVCMLLLSGSALTCAGEASAWHNGTLAHDGQQRYFRLYLPAKQQERPPLVILLHGGTQSMNKIFRRHAGATREWPVLAEEAGFLLLVPNGVNVRTGDAKGNHQNWNDCRAAVAGSGAGSSADDVGFIRALIDRMATRFHIDRNRVYVTGASNGGMMSYRLAIELGDEIAAAAVFIANLPVDNECRQATRPVPMMIVNGTGDSVMPWNGGAVKGGGGRVQSAQETLEYWLRVNRVDRSGAQTTRLADVSGNDKSRVTRTRYPAAPGGADVLFYTVEGGGHTMPHARHLVPGLLRMTLLGHQNRDFDSVRAAWEFLRSQHLDQQAH